MTRVAALRYKRVALIGTAHEDDKNLIALISLRYMLDDCLDLCSELAGSHLDDEKLLTVAISRAISISMTLLGAEERTKGISLPSADLPSKATTSSIRRSRQMEVHRLTILSTAEATPGATLEELRDLLVKKGVVVSRGELRRFLSRHNITPKKTPRTRRSNIARAPKKTG